MIGIAPHRGLHGGCARRAGARACCTWQPTATSSAASRSGRRGSHRGHAPWNGPRGLVRGSRRDGDAGWLIRYNIASVGFAVASR